MKVYKKWYHYRDADLLSKFLLIVSLLSLYVQPALFNKGVPMAVYILQYVVKLQIMASNKYKLLA